MSRSNASGIRDTVESIWVAIVLALVLRGFLLEAFVIPTGSMAPRLLGQHLHLHCPDCAYDFPFGVAFDESANERRVTGPLARCPNCRTQVNYDNMAIRGGDRVLVLKYLYQFRQPQRWDVVVFKDPQGNRQNYIKRLVGLPGEVLRIVQGDVYAKSVEDLNGDGVRDWRDLGVVDVTNDGVVDWRDLILADYNRDGKRDARDLAAAYGEEAAQRLQDVNGDGRRDESDLIAPLTNLEGWRILRKPTWVQKVMWQILFDNDYQPANGAIRYQPWEPLWTAAQGGWDLGPQTGGAMDGDADGFDGRLGQRRVFRYLGGPRRAVQFAADRDEVFRATNPYNFEQLDRQNVRPTDYCGDLKLEATVLPGEEPTDVRFLLSNLDHQVAAEIKADGSARLLYRRTEPGEESDMPWADARVLAETKLPPFRQGEPVHLALTHADYRVHLWVDGKQAMASADGDYGPDLQAIVQAIRERTIAPPHVAIEAEGGPLELWHIRVLRDVYYTSPQLSSATDPRDFLGSALEQYGRSVYPGELENRPGWATLHNPIVLRQFDQRADFDEFFMLGDNSSASHDSRLWVRAAPTLRLYDEESQPQYQLGTVPRYNLIGKAFFVYWPAGNPLPWLRDLPIVPNVGKMRRVN